MAFQGENPEANGYTFHLVVPELDSGAVLFSRQVPVPEYNKSFQPEEKKEQQEYEKSMESGIRIQIIHDQSQFSPHILEALATDWERKIVEDAEAFETEGIAGFENTEAFTQSCKADYEYWKKEGQNKREHFL